MLNCKRGGVGLRVVWIGAIRLVDSVPGADAQVDGLPTRNRIVGRADDRRTVRRRGMPRHGGRLDDGGRYRSRQAFGRRRSDGTYRRPWIARIVRVVVGADEREAPALQRDQLVLA